MLCQIDHRGAYCCSTRRRDTKTKSVQDDNNTTLLPISIVQVQHNGKGMSRDLAKLLNRTRAKGRRCDEVLATVGGTLLLSGVARESMIAKL